MGIDKTEEKKLNQQKNAVSAAAADVERKAFEVKLACENHMTCISTRCGDLEQSFINFSYECRVYSSLCTSLSITLECDLSKIYSKSLEQLTADVKSHYKSADETWKLFFSENVGDFGPLGTSPHRRNISHSSAYGEHTPPTRMYNTSQMDATLSSHVSSRSSFSFEKRKLPLLPDNPTPLEWLEWKAYWEETVVPHFGVDKLGLARATKESCGKSGKFEIVHIPINSTDAYNHMMDSLKTKFDNVSFNVFSVISELSKLRRVGEGDPKSLLALCRKIKGAHGQLKALGHVDKIDYMKMVQVVSLLPNSYQEAWTGIYSAMSVSERCAPFDNFVTFLDSKMSIIQDLVDFKLASDLQSTSSPSASRTPSRARNHQVETYAVDTSCSPCVYHPHSKHSLVDCREFSAKSPRERYDVSVEFALCTRCLSKKHDGHCTVGYTPCTKCDRPGKPASHCDQLCYAGRKKVEKSYGNTTSRSFDPPRGNTSASHRSHAVQIAETSHTSNAPSVGFNDHVSVINSPTTAGNCGCAHPLPAYQSTTCHAVQTTPCGGTRPSGPQRSHGTCSSSQGCTIGVHAAQCTMPPGTCVANHAVPSVAQNTCNSTTTSTQSCSRPHGEKRTTREAPECANSCQVSGSQQPTAEGSGYAVFSHAFVSQIDSTPVPDSPVIPMDTEENDGVQTYSNKSNGFDKVAGIYAIGSVPIPLSDSKAIIFYDQGSDVTCFDVELVKSLNPRTLDSGVLTMTTVTSRKELKTEFLEVSLLTRDGFTVTITGYSLPRLCGKPYKLNEQVINDTFPKFDAATLQRPDQNVNVLLGADYFGYFPKLEIASSGHLSIMRGVLSTCIIGSHPDIIHSNPVNNYAGYAMTFSSYSQILSPRVDTPLLPVRVEVPSTEDGEPCVLMTSGHALPVTSPSSEGEVNCLSIPPGSPPGRLEPESHLDDADCEGTIPETSTTPHGEGEVPASHQPLSLALTAACVAYRSYAVGSEQAAAIEKFVFGEELCTSVKPLCGACKCGKCPIPGQTFSFKEEQELELIQSKLRYLPEEKHWITGYPWKVDPASMPDNYAAAYSTLCRTERTLDKDPSWRSTYQVQIDDHITRGVARKLSEDEIKNWKGPYFYLSHMALEQPKSESTPVRLVFNSSQTYRGVSLNSCLAKGPDCYNNTLFGSMLRMREFPVLMIGDIRKMYNTIRLEPMEQHMHRFLWRSCDSSRKPDVYVITRVNLGDKPSGTIAITAKNNTAHMFSDICPEAAQVLIYCCYTDDLINSIVQDFAYAQWLASKIDEILSYGDFKIKAWLYGGKDVPVEFQPQGVKQLLGTHYRASDDSFIFPAKLNFSAKRRKVPTGPNLVAEELPEGIPDSLSRRIVLQQVMSIYDPLGLLSPLVLQAKILLRRTWELQLAWDELLPPHMVDDWKTFFASLFDAEKIPFARCLTPDGAVGRPSLCLFSDGSEVAYGCVGYVRWKLDDGSYWCHIIMAKCRIAPLSRINIPQMELNGAVVAKRLRQAILGETRLEFDKVYHFIDSKTVLHQISRIAQRFSVYEGVRIGEIQSATHGDMSGWNWIPGHLNVGDLTTKPRGPEDLGPTSVWQRGPDFLCKDESQWPVEGCHTIEDERAPGERYFSFATNASVPLSAVDDVLLPSLVRCSRFSITLGALTRIISAFRHKSLRGGHSDCVTPEFRQRALVCAVLIVQSRTWSTSDEVKYQHRTLAPVPTKDGLWVVGTRVAVHSPFTPENKPQMLLPRHHLFTRRIMEEAHDDGRHSGRDATLARFRSRFVSASASSLAASVCRNCQRCKLLKVKLTQQKMGPLPPERLLPAPVFNSCVLDLFGPYYVKAENQKRTLMKVWGVIFVDLVCRAVHIDIASGYDTKSFLIAFSRFVALRGYPSHIFSDPGTQLVGASKEVKALWTSVRQGTDELSVLSRNGCQWTFGPADSPWYQGSAEALIKSAKRAIDLSVHNDRLLFSELLTSFYEVANLLNERPIGYLPSLDNDISVLTPNMLLLGRSTGTNPGGYQRPMETSVLSLVKLVQEVVDSFWTHWTELYAPTLITQFKWLVESTPLKKNDVVLVADQNTVRGDYRVAVIKEVHPSKDGIIRRVSVRYKNYRTMTKEFKLIGGLDQVVQRSVQRLSLLVPS